VATSSRSFAVLLRHGLDIFAIQGCIHATDSAARVCSLALVRDGVSKVRLSLEVVAALSVNFITMLL